MIGSQVVQLMLMNLCTANELSKADPPEHLSAIDQAPRVTEGRALSWAKMKGLICNVDLTGGLFR